MKIECKIVKFRKGNTVFVVNEKGECVIDETLEEYAWLTAFIVIIRVPEMTPESKRKSWRSELVVFYFLLSL